MGMPGPSHGGPLVLPERFPSHIRKSRSGFFMLGCYSDMLFSLYVLVTCEIKLVSY